MNQWQENLRTVIPYVPGEQPKETGIIKLNTNENPYPPSPFVNEALKELDVSQLRKYPDPTVTKLITKLATTYDVEKENVFVGVGSDDVLATAFLTFFNSTKPILFPDITYSFYEVWANLYQIPYKKLALDETFRIKQEEYKKENGGIVIANPNAPTSIYEGLDVIEEIIKQNQSSIVILDEAYIDFGGESAISLTKQYENLLVVQTFSKSRSLAGLRIGYCIGSKQLIQAMNDVKYSINSYTINIPSIIAGEACLDDDCYFKETVRKIIETREFTKQELHKLGFQFPDSKTNFIFATHNGVCAAHLFDYLKQHGIYVRYFNQPRIQDYLRITIGTQQEMEQLLQTIKQYLKERITNENFNCGR